MWLIYDSSYIDVPFRSIYSGKLMLGDFDVESSTDESRINIGFDWSFSINK